MTSHRRRPIQSPCGPFTQSRCPLLKPYQREKYVSSSSRSQQNVTQKGNQQNMCTLQPPLCHHYHCSQNSTTQTLQKKRPETWTRLTSNLTSNGAKIPLHTLTTTMIPSSCRCQSSRPEHKRTHNPPRILFIASRGIPPQEDLGGHSVGMCRDHFPVAPHMHMDAPDCHCVEGSHDSTRHVSRSGRLRTSSETIIDLIYRSEHMGRP